MGTETDAIDAALLDLLQGSFPVVSRPFEEIGRRLGISADEVLGRVGRLKSEHIIRQISAIFDSSALGYRGALAAFAVDTDRLDAVASLVSAHQGVSHCYSRACEYNLWFTITLAPGSDLEGEVAKLASAGSVDRLMILPALKVYKIGVFLPMGEEPGVSGVPGSDRVVPQRITLTESDRAAVRALQQDMPLLDSPFEAMGEPEGLLEDDLLKRAAGFLETGAMRRFAAVLRHTNAGYTANAMVCWRVEPGRVDEVGAVFASHSVVSHCYERPTYPDWPYSLYTMIHCKEAADLGLVIEGLAATPGVEGCLILHTVREYKKSRVLYFVP